MPKDWAKPLIIMRRGLTFVALEVDRLITEQELVVKPFGKAIAPPSYIYGCTILGDGTLIPVISGPTLIDQILNPTSTSSSTSVTAIAQQSTIPSTESRKAQPLEQVKTIQAPSVLVIDDSAAMRRTLALTLEKAGYRVVQARDGREGLEQLRQTANIQLIICDIEMPNMNGFEFLGQRRRDPQMLNIPVAMLTSRSNEKHRRLAMQLNANAYFTKPYIEQEFISAIKKIISQNSASTVRI
jgi:chemotaxis family two-component system sensor histidine kinase/response regulator PixL